MNRVNIPKLISFYYELKPNPKESLEKVKFGTSGHRGSAFKKSFNESHVLAISKAIAQYKKENNIKGPIFLGIDSHALSTPAKMDAVRVFASEKMEVFVTDEYTPTPLVSFAILEHNKKNKNADGIVITPSHNPPEDGGYKYNPPNGGPADTDVTKEIENKANEILSEFDVNISYEEAKKSEYIKNYDFITPYVNSLKEIVDMDAIKNSNLRLAADPLGGSTLPVYKKIKEVYDLNLEIKNPFIDFTFSFMPPDRDGKIRMDCSSPYAMKNLIKLKDDYDLAFGNDTDGDRHGIVTPVGGLMNPNHFLSVAIWYLFKHRNWKKGLKIGKTLVSSSMIDRVASSLGVEVYETPVGFKYFSKGLYEGWLGFGGEESAGASFLRFDGSVWTTDKDGMIMTLLAAEIKAKIKDPALIYEDLEKEFGKSYYERIDTPTTPLVKEKIKNIDVNKLDIKELASEKIEKIFTKAPGNNEPIGGVKIVTKNGWIAIRPSGTEDVYKIYSESFISNAHLKKLQQEAKKIVEEII